MKAAKKPQLHTSGCSESLLHTWIWHLPARCRAEGGQRGDSLTRTALPVLGMEVSAEGQQRLDGVHVALLQW